MNAQNAEYVWVNLVTYYTWGIHPCLVLAN